MSAVSIQIPQVQDSVNPVVPQVNDSFSRITAAARSSMNAAASTAHVQSNELPWIQCQNSGMRFRAECSAFGFFSFLVVYCISFIAGMSLGVIVSHWLFFLFALIPIFLLAYWCLENRRVNQEISRFLTQVSNAMSQATESNKDLQIQVHFCAYPNLQKIYNTLSEGLLTPPTIIQMSNYYDPYVLQMTPEQIRQCSLYPLREWRTTRNGSLKDPTNPSTDVPIPQLVTNLILDLAGL